MNKKRTIKKVDEGYLVNDIYLIDNDGVIWFDYSYLGNRNRDYPLYLFKLKERVENGENIATE